MPRLLQLGLAGGRPPQLTGSDDQIQCLHPHRTTRFESRRELAQSGVRPHDLRLGDGRQIGGAGEGVTHRVVQVVGSKWFEQHPDGSVRRLDIWHRVGIGGHAENGDARPIPSQGFGELTPIDLRHREVGQDQIERLGARLNESQRGLAVPSLFDVKAFGLERAAEELDAAAVRRRLPAPWRRARWDRGER